MGCSAHGKGNKASKKSGKGAGSVQHAAAGRGETSQGRGGMMMPVAKVEKLLAKFGRDFETRLSKLGGPMKSDVKMIHRHTRRDIVLSLCIETVAERPCRPTKHCGWIVKK